VAIGVGRVMVPSGTVAQPSNASVNRLASLGSVATVAMRFMRGEAMARRIVRGSAGAAAPLVVNVASMGFDPARVTLGMLGIVLPAPATTPANDAPKRVKSAVRSAPVAVATVSVDVSIDDAAARARRAAFIEACRVRDAARANELAKRAPMLVASRDRLAAKYADEHAEARAVANRTAQVRAEEICSAREARKGDPIVARKVDHTPPVRVDTTIPEWLPASIRKPGSVPCKKGTAPKYDQRVRNDSHGSAQTWFRGPQLPRGFR